ncbi:MAG: ABC transporter permease [Clostridiales bacterium]|nr:ABC transporter permease [Clostridiales bacterium]
MGIINWIRDYWRDIRKSAKNTFKNVVLTAHFWVILIAVAIIISMSVMIFNTLNGRRDQYLNEVWQNGGKISYRQMSVFAKGNRVDNTYPLTSLGEGNSITLKDVEDIRESLQGTVDSGKGSGGKKKKSKSTGPVGWEDCYSTTFSSSGIYQKTITVNGVEKTGYIDFDADIVAVGGNFKAFHPFEFMDGGFLPENEYDKNQIVINDELAWKLFKSYSVSGKKVQLFGEEMTIVGVIREKKTKIDEITGSGKYRVFCYFSKIDQLSEKGYFSPGGNTGEDFYATPLAITCYEAFLPEAVKGVAKSDMLNALPSYNVSEPQYRIVSNTGRFRVDNVYDQVMPIGEFNSKTAGYEFPYWEKASILATERLFFFEAALLIGIILLIIGIIIMILRLRKPGGKFDRIEEPEEALNEVYVEPTY